MSAPSVGADQHTANIATISMTELLALVSDLNLHIVEDVGNEDIKVISVHTLSVGGNAIAVKVEFVHIPDQLSVEVKYVGKPFWVYKIANPDDECMFSLKEDDDLQLELKVTPLDQRDVNAYLSMHFNVLDLTRLFYQRTFINIDKAAHKSAAKSFFPPKRVGSAAESNPLNYPKPIIGGRNKKNKPLDEDGNNFPYQWLFGTPGGDSEEEEAPEADDDENSPPPLVSSDNEEEEPEADDDENSLPPLVGTDSEEEDNGEGDDEENDTDSKTPNGMYIGREFVLDLMNSTATATVTFISDEAVVADFQFKHADPNGNTDSFRFDARMYHVDRDQPLTDASNLWMAEIDATSAKLYNAITGKVLPPFLPMVDSGKKVERSIVIDPFSEDKSFHMIGPEDVRIHGYIGKTGCIGWISDDERPTVNFKTILRSDEGVGVCVVDNKVKKVCLFIRGQLVDTV